MVVVVVYLFGSQSVDKSTVNTHRIVTKDQCTERSEVEWAGE